MFGAALPALTLVRVGRRLCGRARRRLGMDPRRQVLPGKLGTIVSSAAIGLVYVGVCVVTGELRPKELMKLRRRAP